MKKFLSGILFLLISVFIFADSSASVEGVIEVAGKDELPRVLGGLGVAILSTNQGIITDKEARKLQVGGEVLAFVW